MNAIKSSKVFLLGGCDLEMLTIKQLLEERNDCIVADKHLYWDNALLSVYQDELSQYTDCEIYGIELKEDIIAPDNYIPIDHHNDKSGQPSSLEQVATLLGVTMTRYHQLVAANDKGYIPAMKALKASKEEIDEIRRKDREAQGVTEEDERKAKDSVDSADRSYPGLIIVNAANSRFSPIVDRLSETYPYHSYIVHTDNVICTYGSIASSFKSCFHESKELYYGGIGDGYAGLSDINKSTMERIIKHIKNMKPISKHIFLFPFKYTKEQNLDEVPLWHRVYDPENENDKIELFNEKQYFYPFVHDALYDRGDDGKKPTLIRHYECQNKDGKYIIIVNEKEYILDIESINVNLYNFGLGILSIHLLNTDIKQSSPEDILKINQFGRRVMPPFYNDITNNPRVELADSIKITWGDGQSIEENFSSFKTEESWKVGAIVSKLLTPLTVEPVIDDRMFTLCYYGNNEEMARIAKAQPQSSDFCRDSLNEGAACKDFWYKFVFVDGGDATCYGEEMYKDLLRKQTYSRWEHPLWGTEYGVSRYSLVALTTETALPYLLDYFETIYTRLAELVLCQRAALVLFSGRISKLANGIIEDNVDLSTELSKKYIQFVNNFCFREVTAQDQGIELYSLLKTTLAIDSYEATLREQILQLHTMIQNISNDKMEKNGLWLNKLAGSVIPITILASLAGLWQLKENGFEWQWVLVFTFVVITGGYFGAKYILKKISNTNNSK